MTTNLPATHAEDLARAAQEFAKRHPTHEGEFLSFKGNQISFNGQRLPGDQACVVIVDDVFENAYYDTEYDPDRPAAPTCYAFGKETPQMGPHPSMQADLTYFKPQASTCKGCPWDEFGSALRGAGKRCKNGTRLALLPAGMYTPRPGSRDFDLHRVDSAKHFEDTVFTFAKLAVGSSKEYRAYVQKLATTKQLPPWAVITRMWLETDTRYQFVTKFEMIDVVPDEWIGVLQRRNAQAADQLTRGYSPPKQ